MRFWIAVPVQRCAVPLQRRCRTIILSKCVGAAVDVGHWLRNQGLGKYEKAFRENAIDLDVLPDLTDDDLAQIGVALGDRKRLLKAVASFSPTGPTSLAETGAPSAAQAEPTKPAPAVSAERRPITVMFCDLVGSTSIAAKLDAEDWRNLVNAYLDEASAAVTAVGGHVLKRLGDGLMALFGYPQAQENDAERAVRAALAIQRALAEINAKNADRSAPACVAGVELGERALDRERGAHRALGVVLLRDRVAEEGHQPVTELFKHMAA